MSALRYLLASLWHYRRTHFAVATGVAVATAVITGALLVGDSVRGSLRDLALERLNSIDTVVLAQQPFRAEFAEELGHRYHEAGAGHFDKFAPLLLVPGSLSTTTSQNTANATQLSILGVNQAFWNLGEGVPADPLSADALAISRSIAAELHAQVGDEVLLRVGVPSNVPTDSTLGEKEDARATRRLRIATIVNTGITRFSLQPSQLEPRNVFVRLPTLQRLLQVPGKANVVAISTDNPRHPSSEENQAQLRSVLNPEFADLGLQIDELSIGDSNDRHCLQLSSERLVLPPQLVKSVREAFPATEVQSVVTYLANVISLGEKQIPYSTVTGIDSTKALGPLWDKQGNPLVLADDEIVLNDWAAAQLDAQVGDLLALKYYEPETTHGTLSEKTTRTLRLSAIAPLHNHEGMPTAVNDQHFTPELPGVTDERSISDWDLPFKLVEEISPADEDYWDQYRTTPKAFVSLKLGDRLWSTRWGTVSALRIPLSGELGASQATERLKAAVDPSDLGMKILPVKAQGLSAARGTTPFEGLFLGFSFFLMAAAIMLIALLFRLGAEDRAQEVGILSAAGLSERRVRRMWLSEAAIVALAGAAVGALLGVAYARLMVYGLTTWWVAATVTPFLKLHVAYQSLLVGFLVGIVVSLIAIARILNRLVRLPTRQLLTGDTSDPKGMSSLAARPKRHWLVLLLLTLAIVSAGIAFAGNLQDEAQAGAFFSSGALVLTALIVWLRTRLRRQRVALPATLTLTGLAMRNTRRNPGRTLLAVALTAVASFLIVALSAFRLAPTRGGTGGFDLLATSDLPIVYDLSTPTGRAELGFSAADEAQLADVQIVSFRVQDGEDASCLNLYQTTQPRVLGVPNNFLKTTDFTWAAKKGSELFSEKESRPLFVALDKSTAIYSLHLSGIGSQFTIRDAFNRPVELEVAGLLAGSILQGNVLMRESDFLQLFPAVAGRRLFLIRCGPNHSNQIANLLETRLAEYGFDAVSAPQRLAEFLAVQNTYLSTFQSLGALGLLLGTFGLAVAQLRSALERRGELALMRSAGFSHSRLEQMMFRENLLLLLGGLGCGCLAAIVATLPHWALSQAAVPWKTLAILLGIVALAGIAAGWLTTRVALRTPLLPALRGD